ALEALGKIVAAWIRGVFDGKVGGIVAQLRPEVLHLRRKALLLFALQQLDDGELEHERANRQAIADFPELCQPDGVDDAAVADVVKMNVEIRLKALLVAAGLIEVGISPGLIREAARNHVDMEIHAEI